jgi:hypothetical protein
MSNNDFTHTHTPSASENTPAPGEVSESFPSELEHSESNYETTLRGADLARFHLKQAQERAYRASVAYAQQLTAQIEADKRKREEVLAELSKLREAITPEKTEPEPELDPGVYLESWD